jgi:hypothetical protein
LYVIAAPYVASGSALTLMGILSSHTIPLENVGAYTTNAAVYLPGDRLVLIDIRTSPVANPAPVHLITPDDESVEDNIIVVFRNANAARVVAAMSYAELLEYRIRLTVLSWLEYNNSSLLSIVPPN